MMVDWRTCAFSDWTCTVGDQKFNVHRCIVGSGSRGSKFFLAAFNKEFKASRTDLTELLPGPCHEHFASAIDFMYGTDVEITAWNALQLLKMADVLQIDPLSHVAREFVEGAGGGGLWDIGGLAVELELPLDLLWLVFDLAPLSSWLGVISSMPDTPLMRQLLSWCSERSQRLEWSLKCANPLTLSTQHLNISKMDGNDGEGWLLSFTGPGAVQLLQLRPGRHSFRIFVSELQGHGPAVGVSARGAAIGAITCMDGGFARNPNCWGLCLESGFTFAQGIGDRSRERAEKTMYLDRTVVLDVDEKAGKLHFRVETGFTETDLGTIDADFSKYGPLMLTVSACCPGTACEVAFSKGCL